MRGPKGEWRPAGIGALAVHICKIATGEIEETYEPPPSEKDPVASRQARARGQARAAKLTPERRSEIAKTAAAARWNRNSSNGEGSTAELGDAREGK